MNTTSKMCKASELREPSLFARYTCAGISCAIFAVWWKYTFVPEIETPGVDVPMHSWHTTALLTVGYLISLPLLKYFTDRFLAGVDVKILLKESMLLYNVAQVVLNGWMVWRFVDAVVNKGHPFIGDISSTSAGTAYAVWVHYCDKYLEFFDTYFMILRGRMDQVCNKYDDSIDYEDVAFTNAIVSLCRFRFCMSIITAVSRGHGGLHLHSFQEVMHTLEHSSIPGFMFSCIPIMHVHY
jgi:hypothetical protein